MCATESKYFIISTSLLDRLLLRGRDPVVAMAHGYGVRYICGKNELS